MKTNLKIAAGLALALGLMAEPAFAQAAAAAARKPAAPAPAAAAPAANAGVVKGIAVLSLEAARDNCDAARYAVQQQQINYKAQIDAVNQRKTSYEAQRKALVDKLNADAAAKKPEAELQAQVNAINTLDQKTQAEIEQIAQPVALSDAYVKEQIEAQLNRAVDNAMAKRGVTLLLRPDVILKGAPGYNLTGEVVAELNVLIPASKIQIIPPAGWLPRQMREQQAAAGQQGAAAAPAGQPASRPSGPQPEGR